MALNIPLPEAPDVSGWRAIESYDNYLKHLLNKKLGEGNLALQRAQEDRLRQLMPYEQQIKAAQAQRVPYQMALDVARGRQASAEADWIDMMLGRGASGGSASSPASTMGGGGWDDVVYPDDDSPAWDDPKQFPDLHRPVAGAPSVSPDGAPVAPQAPQIKGAIPGFSHPLFPNTQGARIISPGDPSRYLQDTYAGFKGMPQRQQITLPDGSVQHTLPSGLVIQFPPQMSKAQLTRDSEFAKVHVKNAQEATEALKQQYEMAHVYAELGKDLDSQEFRNMQTGLAATLGGDRGRSLTLKSYLNYGNKSQKETAARVINRTREIVSKFASVFKGPFRVAEQGLIEDMKPKDNDHPDVALAKLDAMKSMLGFQIAVNERLPEYIEERGMTTTQAGKLIMRELGMDVEIEKMRDIYGSRPSSSQSGGESAFDFSRFRPAGG